LVIGTGFNVVCDAFLVGSELGGMRMRWING